MQLWSMNFSLLVAISSKNGKSIEVRVKVKVNQQLIAVESTLCILWIQNLLANIGQTVSNLLNALKI